MSPQDTQYVEIEADRLKQFSEDLTKAGFEVKSPRHGLLRISHDLLAQLLHLPAGARIICSQSEDSFLHNRSTFRVEHEALPETRGGEPFPEIDAQISHAGAVALWDWQDMQKKTATAIPEPMAKILLRAAAVINPHAHGDLANELHRTALRLLTGEQTPSPEQIEQALESVGMKGYMDREPARLAKGEQPCYYEIRKGKLTERQRAAVSIVPILWKHLSVPNPRQSWDDLLEEIAWDRAACGVCYLWAVPNEAGATAEVYRLDPMETTAHRENGKQVGWMVRHPGNKGMVILPCEQITKMQLVNLTEKAEENPESAPLRGHEPRICGVTARWEAEAPTIGVPAGHPLREVADAISRKSAEDLDRRMMEGSETAPPTEVPTRLSGAEPGWLPDDALTQEWLGHVQDYRAERAREEAPAPPAEDAPAPIRFREFL